MKCFEVLFERGGLTVKAPGVSETELRRELLYYAADSMADVWAAIADLVADPERHLISITERLPQITVLTTRAVPA